MSLVPMSMDPVDKDIWFGDGDKAVLLTDVGVVGHVVCGLVDGVGCRGVVCHGNAEGRAPLDKLSPVGVVGNTPVVEVPKAAGCALISPHKGLEAGVDLDARDDVHRLQQVHKGGAVGGVLVERLLEQAPRV